MDAPRRRRPCRPPAARRRDLAAQGGRDRRRTYRDSRRRRADTRRAGTMTEQAAATGGTTRTPVRAYSTRFAADEDPISEGGMWLNGKRDGIEWADVIVRNGLAHGAPTMMSVAERRLEQGNLTGADAGAGAPEGDYDDPT